MYKTPDRDVRKRNGFFQEHFRFRCRQDCVHCTVVMAWFLRSLRCGPRYVEMEASRFEIISILMAILAENIRELENVCFGISNGQRKTKAAERQPDLHAPACGTAVKVRYGSVLMGVKLSK